MIHGIFSLKAPVEKRLKFDDAVRMFRTHYEELLEKSLKLPSIANGAPSIVEEAGGLEFRTTDEFWTYDVDLDFWENLAKKFPEISVSLYYGSAVAGEKCGMLISVDGRITNVRYEDGSPEAVEFSRGINVMDGL